MKPDPALPQHIQRLQPEVAAALRTVEPTKSPCGFRYYPCEVTLDDGTVLPRVYLLDACSYIRAWGVWPWEDRDKSWVPAERIRSLRSSPHRLPPEFANRILAAGESGMGYCCFRVELRDGRWLYYITGNAVDFPNWESGISPEDVVNVVPHARNPEHEIRKPAKHESSAPYVWSPFRTDRRPWYSFLSKYR